MFGGIFNDLAQVPLSHVKKGSSVEAAMEKKALAVNVKDLLAENPRAESHLSSARQGVAYSSSGGPGLQGHLMPEDDVCDLAIASSLGEAGAFDGDASPGPNDSPDDDDPETGPMGPKAKRMECRRRLEVGLSHLKILDSTSEFVHGLPVDKCVSLNMFSNRGSPTITFMQWRGDGPSAEGQQIFIDHKSNTLKYTVHSEYPYRKQHFFSDLKFLHANTGCKVVKAKFFRDPVPGHILKLKAMWEGWLNNSSPKQVCSDACGLCGSLNDKVEDGSEPEPVFTCCVCLSSHHPTCLKGIVNWQQIPGMVKTVVPSSAGKLKVQAEFKQPNVRCILCSALFKLAVG